MLLQFSSCAFEDGKRVAPQWFLSGSQKIIYNLDNLGWEESTITTDTILFRDIESNNSKELIAVGQNGNIWHSYNLGKSWYDRTAENGNTSRLWEVTYNNGKYVAVGNSGIIVTSDDGKTWDNRSSGVIKVLRGVAYGNSKYVVVGHGGTVLTSTDSISWTAQTEPTAQNLFGLNYLNNIFIGVGNNGTILTSSDGINWSLKTSGTSESFKEISYGNGVYVAVATNGVIYTSTDTNTWTSRTSATDGDLWAVEFGNGYFLAGGVDLVKSIDGTTWEKITTNVIYGIEYIEGSVTEYVIRHNPSKPSTNLMFDLTN